MGYDYIRDTINRVLEEISAPIDRKEEIIDNFPNVLNLNSVDQTEVLSISLLGTNWFWPHLKDVAKIYRRDKYTNSILSEEIYSYGEVKPYLFPEPLAELISKANWETRKIIIKNYGILFSKDPTSSRYIDKEAIHLFLELGFISEIEDASLLLMYIPYNILCKIAKKYVVKAKEKKGILLSNILKIKSPKDILNDARLLNYTEKYYQSLICNKIGRDQNNNGIGEVDSELVEHSAMYILANYIDTSIAFTRDIIQCSKNDFVLGFEFEPIVPCPLCSECKRKVMMNKILEVKIPPHPGCLITWNTILKL